MVGRWISQDPIGFAAGDANLYRYVGNKTTTYTDPSGLYEDPRPYPVDGGGPATGDSSYIHGRVELLALKKPKPSNKGKLTTDFSFSFRVLPKKFRTTPDVSADCKKCKKVGYVQIVKQKFDRGLIPAPTENYDWKIDAGNTWGNGIPYPEGTPLTADPTLGAGSGDWGETMRFVDIPGIVEKTWRGRSLELVQDFEVHLVCLDGLEKGSTYGGFKGGQSFKWNKATNSYDTNRYHQQIFEPSSTFKSKLSQSLPPF